MYFKSKRI